MKRTDIRRLLLPFVDQLADQMAEVVTEHIDGLLERARAYAIEKLRAELSSQGGGTVDAPALERVPTRERRKAKAGRPRSDAPRGSAGSNPAPDTKRTNTCRKCGAIGFTARTCGKTHNVGDRDVKPANVIKPPPTTSRADRFAAIEAAAAARRAAALDA